MAVARYRAAERGVSRSRAPLVAKLLGEDSRVLDNGHAAHRVPDHDHRAVRKMRYHRFKVPCVRLHRPVVGGGSLRLAVAAHVVNDDAELVRELLELVMP